MNVTRQSLTAEPPFRLGEVLDGKYYVEEILREDEHTLLAAARHRVLDREVAIKALRPDIARARPDLLQQFIKQASGLAQMRNPHVPELMDIQQLENGGVYAIMERLHGYHLGRVLAAGGTFGDDDAIRHAIVVCGVLVRAHLFHQVHGTLRPASLFRALREDGPPTIKVLGFIDTFRPAHASAAGDIQAVGALLESLRSNRAPWPGLATILTRCRSGGFASVGELQSALMELSYQIKA